MKLLTFDSYNLPMARGEWKFPLASLRGGRSLLAAAGVWDDLGDLVVLRPGLVQAKFAMHGTTWDSVDAALDLAKAGLFAGRGYLQVTVGDDGTATRRALARCLALDVPYKFDKPRLVICAAKFELLQPHWDAINQSTSSPSTTSFNVDNSGSTYQTQRTLVIRLNGPLSASFTLTNTMNGMAFTYDGASSSIASGHYVDVDCGARSVLYDGSADRWPYLSIGNNQIGFMALDTGVNAFTASPAMALGFTWRKSYL